MPKKQSSSRQRIIEAAVWLFYANGYSATGVAEILKKAKVNSGSFYFFFKSKEELLLAVLDWYLENLEPILLWPVYEVTDDPIERVFALLDGYRQKILMTEFDFTCPIGRLALEIDPARKQVHAKIAANFRGWTEAVKRCLEDAGERLPNGTDTEALAKFVLTVMEGGVMQSRSHKSIVPFDASIEQLRQYFRFLEQSKNSSPRAKDNSTRR
ncbi:TetR/AcrR family transcriptional regulator [Alloacidobacterium dinghuense]|uniref:TetR/AcrR family transcriptional regulator n=1 Tax=Alloacidobacterium dinghuense TaxID=2763107 RepID=A0A7G8BLU8_9BACT|nr:TetR/AcrR family transcriptional regulator [Alloacidobacterium dinghuense]QNI33518.1 TetR/AcrR family transcriptional regulator [Alloacidobacterium dinghuense]